MESLSAKVRDYAIAGSCAVLFVFLVAGVVWSASFARQEPVNVWSTCTSDSADVFVDANYDIKNVRCVALDGEFFAEPNRR